MTSFFLRLLHFAMVSIFSCTILTRVSAAADPGLPTPAFVDVAATHGIASNNSARSQLIDVDGDGWPDLVI